MMDSFEASSVLVASIVIIVLPALIIGVGELEERLRQRDSSLQPSVAIVRIWVVPLAAVWMLARTLFDVSSDNVLIRLLGSGSFWPSRRFSSRVSVWWWRESPIVLDAPGSGRSLGSCWRFLGSSSSCSRRGCSSPVSGVSTCRPR